MTSRRIAFALGLLTFVWITGWSVSSSARSLGAESESPAGTVLARADGDRQRSAVCRVIPVCDQDLKDMWVLEQYRRDADELKAEAEG